MPAYSYQERFVPMLLDGSKTSTLRDRRRYLPRKGQRIYHYFALRTALSTKVMESECTGARSLSITPSQGIILYNRLLDVYELETVRFFPLHHTLATTGIRLDKRLRDLFAWKDGFRPARTTEAYPGGAYDLMMRYYSMADRLPWSGDIILLVNQ